ncbi:MAG: GNAT family N-acetyltransferase [Corallococcus sp.]|nr:GNAT family N-acetyltransferase [Corallococcus sp.]MCM1359371.1 GNAT family N-acetyltransferase [Corallococcus sp.]MCM1394814.1 GNAT family N-acetyltransferase [Corallococcus sp.]
MITVRPYQKKDFRYVQDICFATSWLKDKPNQTNRAIVCAMYCDYYLDNEPEYCFVAVDENDVPVGYVLCAVELDAYRDELTENYLPVVRKLSSSDYFRFNAEIKLEQRFIRQGYTAHLHVDILEDYQRQGVGTKLLETLQDKLKQNFVEGVYLVCGLKNEAARSFYEKRGFTDIDYFTGCVVYGKKLFSEEE